MFLQSNYLYYNPGFDIEPCLKHILQMLLLPFEEFPETFFNFAYFNNFNFELTFYSF